MPKRSGPKGYLPNSRRPNAKPRPSVSSPHNVKNLSEQSKTEHASGKADQSQKRRTPRPLPPNPERKKQLPELVKKFGGLQIGEESRKYTKSSVPKLPTIQKRVEKASTNNKPSRQESKQKTTIAADNSRQRNNSRLKNNSRQKQTDNIEETKTCTLTCEDSLICKLHSETTQQIGLETEEVTNQLKEIDAKLKVAEQSSASLQHKETVDDNEHTQTDMNEEIADGDTKKETDGNSRTSKKRKRQRRNGLKTTDERRMNEKTRDHSTETDGKTIRSPTGLINLGNTCFFNAIMQNLNQSFVLGELLSEKKLDFPLTKSVVEFYEQMDRKGNKQLNPNRLFQSLCNRSPRFKGGHQQDSHELLRHLLDGLRNEEREASRELDKRKILTTVDRTFGGHFLTVYNCNDCSKPYHVCEPFLDISLPIQLQDFRDEKIADDELNVKDVARSLMKPLNEHRHEIQDTRKSSSNKDGSESNPSAGSKRKWKKDSASIDSRPRKRSRTEGLSILDCLDAFTRTEFITKEYLCMGCHEKRVSQGETDYKMSSAIKRTLVFNPPALLTLHLKRFTQTSRGFVKCNDMITFPDLLDLSPYCSFWCMRNDGNEKNIWYSLYGVVVHGGELSGGHYSAFVKLRTPDVNVRKFLQQTFLDRDKLTEDKLVEMMTGMKDNLKQNPRVDWKPQLQEAAVQGNWFYVSDCHCSPVTENDVFQRPAYLLFYERMTRLNAEL